MLILCGWPPFVCFFIAFYFLLGKVLCASTCIKIATQIKLSLKSES